MFCQKRFPRPGLLTSLVVQIPLGTAISENKPNWITGAWSQGMTQHQNGSPLSKGSPCGTVRRRQW
ncbi:hypothetical protein MARHY1043 [Marinobacter nauticus ATCC 49840]|nr:hypothetical protein MARHY1043 [Marinobacter nauticus ATCC 49840]